MSAGPDPAIRVLVVDDHPIWREGTARYLSEAGYTIAGTAGDGAQALRIIAATRPDVVLLDLNLPGESGTEVARRLLAAQPSVRVLMLSASGAQQDVLDAVTAGAVGYVLQSAQLTELVDAVRSAAAGHPVFTPALAWPGTRRVPPARQGGRHGSLGQRAHWQPGHRDNTPADRPGDQDRAEPRPQHPHQAPVAQQGATGALRPGERRGLTVPANRARGGPPPCPRSSSPRSSAAVSCVPRYPDAPVTRMVIA